MALHTTRRRLLALGTGLGLSALGLSSLGPRQVRPAEQPALLKAPPPDHTLDERLNPILKGRKPRHERVELEVPDIAEDGSVVPVHVRVDSPMTPQDYVRRLFLLVDNNPDPLIFAGTLSPQLGQVEWWTKIRMAKSSNVRAIAETSKGELLSDEREIKITLSGCG
jgi:sulfur-oxidizing protein SoxY